jgi:hypothetical protein
MFGYPSLDRSGASVVALLMGPTWEARRYLVLDAGLIAPLTGPQPRAFYAGVTWNIGKLWATSATPGHTAALLDGRPADARSSCCASPGIGER